MIRGMEPDEPQPRDAGGDDAGAPGPSWQGQVLYVSGRGSDDGRGLPPVHEITLTQPGGPDLVFGRIRNDARAVRVPVLGAPEFHDSERCPICGAADEGSTIQRVAAVRKHPPGTNQLCDLGTTGSGDSGGNGRGHAGVTAPCR